MWLGRSRHDSARPVGMEGGPHGQGSPAPANGQECPDQFSPNLRHPYSSARIGLVARGRAALGRGGAVIVLLDHS